MFLFHLIFASFHLNLQSLSSQCVTTFCTLQSLWQPCLNYSKTVAQEIFGLMCQIAQCWMSSRRAIRNRRNLGMCLTQEQATKLLYWPSEEQLLQTRQLEGLSRPIPVLYNRTHHHRRATNLNLPSDRGIRSFLKKYPTVLQISLRAALLHHTAECY